MRIFKNLIKKLLRILLEFLQPLGINILPSHFYSEVPCFRELRTNLSWKEQRSMFGINGVVLEEQLSFIQSCSSNQLIEYLKKGNIHKQACLMNYEQGFGVIEADFLFCFISTKKPKKIIQCGAGVSTAVILLASRESSQKPEILCIDPYPSKLLVELSSKQEITLISKKAQEVPLETLLNLNEGDLFFVDSTHAVKPGSEVNKIILEVLPRMKRNIYVHFHDIYFPYDYPRDLLCDCLFFSNESTLLQAFLTNNSKYKIEASLSMLHYFKSVELQKMLPNYIPQKDDYGLRMPKDNGLHFPSSIYLRTIE